MTVRYGAQPSFWINQATRAHADKYIILIAFLPQKWLRERASLLSYTYSMSVLL